jgi:uncharacterized protein (DUF362 family)
MPEEKAVIDNEKPIVSIVRSETSIYDNVDFKNMIQRSLENLESEDVHLPSAGRVFIKPNVVIGVSARESVTTEPKFISNLIMLLKQRGVSTVYVGDSSAGYIQSVETFKSTGMADAVLKAGGEVVDIDAESERVELQLPNSDILERLTVPRKAMEADFLINFGKLKTHRIGNSITCCVKNWVGFIAQDVRLRYHQTRLPKLVSELHRALPENLCFGDAVMVGEGDGPDLPKPRFLGLLLSANDPVAIDSIGAELLSINRSDLVFPWTAHLDGIGEIRRDKIKVIGPEIQRVAIRAEKPVAVLYNRFPCNVVLGGMCEGCFAWFMGPALFWERDGIWREILQKCGKPTFMMGFNAEDVHFEKHLEEGPYFVIGDCTPAKYREDSRTTHIEGCCPGPAIPEIILNTCGIEENGGQK